MGPLHVLSTESMDVSYHIRINCACLLEFERLMSDLAACISLNAVGKLVRTWNT